MLNNKHANNVIVPIMRFLTEPKSSAYPPPNERTPTDSKEYPIVVTTIPATTGVMILLQYFAIKPSVPSKNPPTITEPTTAS